MLANYPIAVTSDAREEPEILAAIFERIACGEAASKACDTEQFLRRTFWRRVAADASVRGAYELALTSRAHFYAEEITELSDERPPMVGDTNHQAGESKSADGNTRMDSAFVAWQRLRMDSRKWVISKLLPKKYADKLDLTHADPEGGPVSVRVLFGRD